MNYKSIGALPGLDAVSAGDLLVVEHNGSAAKVDAVLFKGEPGEPATINGTRTLKIAEGANINLLQQGDLLIISTEKDFTSAEKLKLAGIEAGAQVNEVTAEQYRESFTLLTALKTENDILRKKLENLLSGLEIPIYMNGTGTGVIEIEDAAAGQIHSVTVDKSLSGKTVYIQLSNASGLTNITGTVDKNGTVTLSKSVSTVEGYNRFYITNTDYAFPAGNRSGFDTWISQNGIAATVRYQRDSAMGTVIDTEISYDEFLAMYGVGVNYVSTDSPAADSKNYEIYIDLGERSDPYPRYSRVKVFTSGRTYYRAEYYLLNAGGKEDTEDITRMARLNSVDFSRFSNGIITENWDDGIGTVETRILFDEDGNPVAFTDGDGHITHFTYGGNDEIFT